jgi:hypothetical protein
MRPRWWWRPGGGAGSTRRQINEGGGGSARCRVRVWGCHGLVEGGASGVREVCDGAESRAAREGEARGA